MRWKKEDKTDPDTLSRFLPSPGLTLTWTQLRKKLRVVVLAEGGSGKSTEFERQAVLLTADGKDAWDLRVLDVAQHGLKGSMSPGDRKRYRKWRDSDREAWFFVDSVDEARLNQVQFGACLRNLADGIAGAERRAHVVISSRHPDWETIADLNRFSEWLPVPTDQPDLSPPTPDERLLALLHNGRKSSRTDADANQDSDAPLLVVMLGLDQDRVRRYAESLGLPKITEFLQAIDHGNLWQFARRPGDLSWLLDYWRRFGRLGP